MKIITKILALCAALCGMSAGATGNVNMDFTNVSSLPGGWTEATPKNESPLYNYDSTKGATVSRGWNQDRLYTAIDMDYPEEITVDIETYSNNSDCDSVIFLSSSSYSVCIGNSYTSNKEIAIGTIDSAAADKFVSFQSNTGTNPTSKKTIAEADVIDVSKPLTYHLVLNGTALTGTVTDGATTKDITYTLNQGYAFTHVGIQLDGYVGAVGVKSIKVKAGRDARTVTCTGNVPDWTKDTTFTYNGEQVTYALGDTVEFTGSGVVYVNAGYTIPLNIKIDEGKSVTFGHNDEGNNKNLNDGTVVTMENGAKLVFTFWGNAKAYDCSIGNITVNGGTIGLDTGHVGTVTLGNIAGTSSTLSLTSSDKVILGGTITSSLSGSGTVQSTANTSLTFANDWTGTVVLPSFQANGQNLNGYGTSSSTIKLMGVTSGWIAPWGMNVDRKIELGGNVNITALSATKNYYFKELCGSGVFSIADSNENTDNTITIGRISSADVSVVNAETTHCTLTISELALTAEPSVGDKILTKTGAVAVTAITVNGETATFATEMRDDGLYVVPSKYTVSFRGTGVTYTTNGQTFEDADYEMEEGELSFTLTWDGDYNCELTIGSDSPCLTSKNQSWGTRISADTTISATLTKTAAAQVNGKAVELVESGSAITATVDPGVDPQYVFIYVNGKDVTAGFKVSITDGVMTAVLDEETPETDAIEQILTGKDGDIDVVKGLCYGVKSGTALTDVKDEPETKLNETGKLTIEAGNFVKIRITTAPAAEVK